MNQTPRPRRPDPADLPRPRWCGECHRTMRLTADGRRCPTCNPLHGRNDPLGGTRPWCGHCDKNTRLTQTPDGPARCRNCHPLGRPPAQWPMFDVPEGRTEQILACDWLRYISPLVFAKIGTEELREELRVWFNAGWTPRDVIYAMDNLPTGGAQFGDNPSGKVTPKLAVSFIRRRLRVWLDDAQNPLPAVNQHIAHNRDRIIAARAAKRAEWEERERAAVPAADSVAAVQARIIADRARLTGAQHRREADARELDRRQADIAARNQAVSAWSELLNLDTTPREDHPHG